MWAECLCPPKIHVEILTPEMMTFDLGPWGGNSSWRRDWTGLLLLQKKAPESSLAYFPLDKEKRSRLQVTWKRALTRTQLCWHPDLRLPAFRTVKNKSLLFLSHVGWYFVRAVQTKMIHNQSQPNSHYCLPFNLSLFSSTLTPPSISETSLIWKAHLSSPVLSSLPWIVSVCFLSTYL